MYDYHIHMYSGPGDTPQEFLRRTAEAGVTGGGIISPQPLGYSRVEGADQRWESLLDCLLEKARIHPEFRRLEGSWVLEDNTAINDLIEDFSGRITKRYRLYRREIDA